jgi:hypothetical protein
MRLPLRCSILVVACFAAVGCGSSSSSSSTPAQAGASTPASGSSTASSGPAGGSAAGSPPAALSADAHSAATGDIPDNQVFLVFHDSAAGYSIKYPEGWTQRGSGGDVTFQDKNNIVHIVVSHSAAPTPVAVAAELRSLRSKDPTLSFTAPATIQLGSRSLVKSVYKTLSAPNQVTGERVRLIVDRYAVSGPGKHAVIDLGTPTGVDNVDAYRMMIESFTWK